MMGCGELYCANNPLVYIDPMGLWAIGFKLFGFGFSIGDKGVSVSLPVVTLGVDFQDGSFYGSIGADVGSHIELGETSIGYTLGVSYNHNFSRGGNDLYGVYAGGWIDAGGTSYGGGYFYTPRDGRVSNVPGDFFFDIDRMGESYNRVMGSAPDMSPGEGVPGIDGVPDRKEGQTSVPGTNPWGNPANKRVELSLNPLSWLDWTFTNVIPGREGGPISTVANKVPGQAAFAHYHDALSTNLMLAMWYAPFSQITTYGAHIRNLSF
ncbi:MAG: hypothetical protein GY730_11325 [bacterium]|nr:hypothetical protein [bacterium]